MRQIRIIKRDERLAQVDPPLHCHNTPCEACMPEPGSTLETFRAMVQERLNPMNPRDRAKAAREEFAKLFAQEVSDAV